MDSIRNFVTKYWLENMSNLTIKEMLQCLFYSCVFSKLNYHALYNIDLYVAKGTKPLCAPMVTNEKASFMVIPG